MSNYWHKLGLLYRPPASGLHPKLLTHAANPVPVLLEGDVFRVFFSGRDCNNRSSVGAVDINIVQQTVVTAFSEPFFVHGPPGSFYAEGVSIGNYYQVADVRYLLFMAWQTPSAGHWRGDIGRLIVKPDLTLEISEELPFLSSDTIDPISLSYPWVTEIESGVYEMWYGSTLTWAAENGEMVHVLKHATSDDGHHFKKTNLCIPYELGLAQAFSKPTIIGNAADGFKMWFSYRSGNGDKYRIGCATSSNGRNWLLDLANCGIGLSDSGWDSEMIEYPFVFQHKSQLYMLYNGNDFGKSGFGLALYHNLLE